MSFSTTLLAPLVLLLPLAGALETAGDAPAAGEAAVEMPAQTPVPDGQQAISVRPPPHVAGWGVQVVIQTIRPDPANQVRIEQRMTVRVAPRALPMPPTSFIDMPDHAISPRFVERRIGKCVSASAISGVQTGEGNRLLLFMRDRRIISARLERSCRARDFYSGFYLASSADGNLCVDRDILQSRSGANCKLTQIRRLVELDP